MKSIETTNIGKVKESNVLFGYIFYFEIWKNEIILCMADLNLIKALHWLSITE